MDEFISDYDKACEQLGISSELPDVSKMRPKMQRHTIAAHKLGIIIEANNGDWVADLADKSQWKWYPFFDITKDKEAPLGFRLSFAAVCDDADMFLGCRLACKSEELAQFMGENCNELYEELHA